MKVEMSKTDSYYHIRIPIADSYRDKYLRKFLDYLRLKKISSKSRATDNDIDALSEDIMLTWWNKNKSSFSK